MLRISTIPAIENGQSTIAEYLPRQRAPSKVILKRKTGVSSENKIEVFFKRGDQMKGSKDNGVEPAAPNLCVAGPCGLNMEEVLDILSATPLAKLVINCPGSALS
jgi:hypothetical protein